MKWMRMLAAVTMTAAITPGGAACEEKGAGEKAGKAPTRQSGASWLP